VFGGNDSVNIKLSQAGGTLSATVTISYGLYPEFAVGDFSGDGINDVIVASQYGPANLHTGNGSGGFSAGVSVASGTGIPTYTAIIAGDFNRDGLSDFATTFHDGYTSGNLIVAINTGNSKFQNSTSALDFNLNDAISPIDLDNDGFIDLFGSNSLGSPRTMKGNGVGAFSTPAAFTGLVRPAYAAGDLNSDGVNDFITHSAGLTYSNLQNTQDTTNSKYVTLATQADARAALETVDATINRLTAELGTIGAAQSRMQTMLSTLTVDKENATAAASRISDADIATESAQMIRTQIIQQSAQAILAQANQAPTLALRLLRAGL
jgi:flagellin-like hook-associated protein FlgL